MKINLVISIVLLVILLTFIFFGATAQNDTIKVLIMLITVVLLLLALVECFFTVYKQYTAEVEESYSLQKEESEMANATLNDDYNSCSCDSRVPHIGTLKHMGRNKLEYYVECKNCGGTIDIIISEEYDLSSEDIELIFQFQEQKPKGSHIYELIGKDFKRRVIIKNAYETLSEIEQQWAEDKKLITSESIKHQNDILNLINNLL